MVDLVVSTYDPQSQPPYDVIQAIESGVVQITRRVEIYEADTTTRWYPDGADDEVYRLIEGSVSVDYGSDERRKLDLTLDNEDMRLRPNPFNGLWYDKVIKVYRGVQYDSSDVPPRVAIIEAEGGLTEANRLQQMLGQYNYTDTDIKLGENDPSDLRDYAIVASYMQTGASAVGDMLAVLYEQGKTILTVGVGNTTQLPHYTGLVSSGGAVTHGIDQYATDNPARGAFTSEAASPTATGYRASATATGAVPLAVWPATITPTYVTAAIVRNGNGGFWLDIRLPNLNGTQAQNLLRVALDFVRYIEPIRKWENQLGEFFIDGIDADNFPDFIKITARDGTKKLINSKLTRTSTFIKGTSLKNFVIGEAALAGIPVSKMRFDIGDEVLASDMTFDKGTSRWDMIKSALEAFGYERFFDNLGNFVVRKYIDPSTAPCALTFKTGPDGNLVRYSKSINDSLVYNHIIVTSDPNDEDANPTGYFGEAMITDASVPTHKDRIGDRVLPVDAPWLSSDEECEALAVEKLKIAGLESYDLSFDSIYYSWLEAGTIICIEDPDALPFEPDKFLLIGIEYGLGLGAMSATGKRVTFVGSPGGTGA